MTINYATGEIVGAPTYGEVKESIAKALSGLEAAAEQIIWQIENQAWIILGYADWNEMREAEYGGAAFMVPRAERPELVARMRRSGMTQQDIADTAGVSVGTVNADLNFSSENEERDYAVVTNTRGQQRPTTYSKPSPTATVEQAVSEFPDLAHYAETGRADDAVQMAGDLRRYRDRGELDDRLATLRRSIEIDQSKRDGTYVAPSLPKVCHACGQTVPEKS